MYLLASQTVASCQGEGTKHSDTMLKSYIREALGEGRAGKRLCKSTGRPVRILLIETYSRMQCCQSLQSHPHKALIYYRITPKHLTLPPTRPPHFKPTADLQVTAGLPSNRGTGRGRTGLLVPHVLGTPGLGVHIRSRAPEITAQHAQHVVRLTREHLRAVPISVAGKG